MDQPDRDSFVILVPTLNAGTTWHDWITALNAQTVKPRQVYVMDSESTDETIPLARAAGLSVVPVERKTFNHGGTRQDGLMRAERSTDLLVCMTQDAVLADQHALANLIEAFKDPCVSVAFGRQLPAVDANPLATHARLFNYPTESRTVALADRDSMGFKVCFLSNSFAAYRIQDLETVGGFPRDVILGEDTTVAARLLLAGKAIRYQADACVYHSHNYTALEEFRRYFDTGVFHARAPWLMDTFGGAGGEGFRFVTSEMRYLVKHSPGLIPSALFHTACKLAGYRLGLAETWLPVRLKRQLSMFKGFWG